LTLALSHSLHYVCRADGSGESTLAHAMFPSADRTISTATLLDLWLAALASGCG
jgi:hypothetical protein